MKIEIQKKDYYQPEEDVWITLIEKNEPVEVIKELVHFINHEYINTSTDTLKIVEHPD